MNHTEAISFIVARLQPDVDPAMDPNVVVDLVDLAKTDDADGLSPDDADWEPTYSTTGCYRAIAEGYAIKYGAAVARFRFGTDGQTFDRNQILDHLEHQRRLWARKVQTTTATPC